MSRIRGYDTKPEILVRRLLYQMGYRFRIRNRGLPGNPDVLLRRHKTVVFVHGCFWHRHPGCKFSYTPKSRIDFWRHKFSDTIERDRRAEVTLRKTGWNVVVVWECETADLGLLGQRLRTNIGETTQPTRKTGTWAATGRGYEQST
jgi:DNA mismatch endonuclease, patch repair protein